MRHLSFWTEMSPKEECTPPINLEVFFADTLDGLETTIQTLEKFRNISDNYDVFMTSKMSYFYMILQLLATESAIDYVRNSWFSLQLCVLIGSNNSQSLMCMRLGVVELLRHNPRKFFSNWPPKQLIFRKPFLFSMQ